jgi:protoporphyrinogen oxidase
VIEETDVLILGGGLTGLSAAAVLGDHATVLEREGRPGGLVRTECFAGYWFDHVIHLLYFPDAATEGRVRALPGADLVPCPATSWVETAAGTARFPLQMHLGSLQQDAVIRCVRDFAEATFAPAGDPPGNYEEMLLRTFGRALCEIFFFPYNRKMWRRPLKDLAPSGFHWNIARPRFAEVLRGVLAPERPAGAYNADGWYPRPPRGSPVRGMEVLSRALARQVPRLLLGHTVESIDLKGQVVTARHEGRPVSFRFRHACLSTLPLPQVVGMCRPAPADLLEACRCLVHNRVLSAAFSIRGPRPVGRGHWRYYTDESLVFTRLVHLHEFDPDSAPAEGWPLLAEIPEPGEGPAGDPAQTLARARADVLRAGALPAGCTVADQHLLVVEPAYVVFTPQNQAVMQWARRLLADHGIDTLGRYGRWEYSSMGQVMCDGFRWGERVRSQLS